MLLGKFWLYLCLFLWKCCYGNGKSVYFSFGDQFGLDEIEYCISYVKY